MHITVTTERLITSLIDKAKITRYLKVKMGKIKDKLLIFVAMTHCPDPTDIALCDITQGIVATDL